MGALWDNRAMKLQVPFVQLPLCYDAARLLEEVERLGEDVWRPHPQGYAGNSALPLIAVNGDPSSDSISGPMRPTPHLEACPYLRQVMASLGAIWGRSRLMRLSGHAEVPRHADLAYYWRDRVRVHVPIQTQPTVRFQCGDAEVNMAAGECWIFDTWRPHRVINADPAQRIHLVADTVGGEQFWEHASGGRVPGHPVPGWQPRLVAADPASDSQLVYESENLGSVMTPWELREHLNFIISEAAPAPQLAAIQQVCQRFNAIWLGLWARYGTSEQGWADYRAALEPFAAAVQSLGSSLLLKNGMRFIGAFRAMIVQAALSDDRKGGLEVKGDYDPDAFAEPANAADTSGSTAPATRLASPRENTHPATTDTRFDRPVIILSPPRSGSTLLFETLMRARDVYTVGGESHVQIEGMSELHPSARDFDSNALGVEAATRTSSVGCASDSIRHCAIAMAIRHPLGAIRLLEKTPKNALRIPFLREVFPDAHFIYLYRDPREVSVEHDRGMDLGHVSHLPAVARLAGARLVARAGAGMAGADRAAIAGNRRTAMGDDHAHPARRPRRGSEAERIHRIRYDAFLAEPACADATPLRELELDWDVELESHLPIRAHTLSAPAAGQVASA